MRFALAVAACCAAVPVLAQETQVVLHHAGRLVDSADNPVTTAVELEVRLMKARDTAEVVWTDTFQVSPFAGTYAVVLGDTLGGHKALTPADVEGERWLSILVDDVELLPRLRLGAVPFALAAGRAAQALHADEADEAGHAGTADEALHALDADALEGLSLAELDARFAPAAGAAGYVQLQASAPGTAQAGHVAVTGTVTAETLSGRHSGDGAGLTGVDAAKLDGRTADSFASSDHHHDGVYVKVSGSGGALSATDVTASGTVTAAAFKVGSQDLLAMFDGVSRACPAPGYGVQTFDGEAGTWSACPTAWNCTANPSHPGCASSSAYRSCKAIKQDPAFTGADGLYWIDPDGTQGALSPVQVYCDMATDGGGWTLVARMTAGGDRLHNNCSAVGTLTNPEQGATAKLSDAAINAMGGENFRLVCNSITTYWDAASRVWNACSDAGSIRRGRASLAEAWQDLPGDNAGRGITANASLGGNVYYGYRDAGQPGCHSSGWGRSGHLYLK